MANKISISSCFQVLRADAQYFSLFLPQEDGILEKIRTLFHRIFHYFETGKWVTEEACLKQLFDSQVVGGAVEEQRQIRKIYGSRIAQKYFEYYVRGQMDPEKVLPGDRRMAAQRIVKNAYASPLFIEGSSTLWACISWAGDGPERIAGFSRFFLEYDRAEIQERIRKDQPSLEFLKKCLKKLDSCIPSSIQSAFRIALILEIDKKEFDLVVAKICAMESNNSDNTIQASIRMIETFLDSCMSQSGENIANWCYENPLFTPKMNIFLKSCLLICSKNTRPMARARTCHLAFSRQFLTCSNGRARILQDRPSLKYLRELCLIAPRLAPRPSNFETALELGIKALERPDDFPRTNTPRPPLPPAYRSRFVSGRRI